MAGVALPFLNTILSSNFELKMVFKNGRATPAIARPLSLLLSHPVLPHKASLTLSEPASQGITRYKWENRYQV